MAILLLRYSLILVAGAAILLLLWLAYRLLMRLKRDRLADRLDDPDAAASLEAAMALGEAGDRRAAPRLLQALGDPDPAVRRAAAGPLVKALGEEWLREAVGRALADAGEEGDPGALIEALGEDWLREAVSRALAEAAGRRADREG